MKKIILSTAAAISIGLLLSGCTRYGSSTANQTPSSVSPTPASITENNVDEKRVNTGSNQSSLALELNEYTFTPQDIISKVGQTSTINLRNSGSLTHTFTVRDLNIDLSIPPGESDSIDITPTTVGSYELECTIPGHKDLGMHGTITVE